jgi:hypothetical protein
VSSEAFGQYGNALRAVSFYTAEGWSQDVSEDIAGSTAPMMWTRRLPKAPSGSSTGTLIRSGGHRRRQCKKRSNRKRSA